jgi:ferredoxin-type protein NapG
MSSEAPISRRSFLRGRLVGDVGAVLGGLVGELVGDEPRRPSDGTNRAESAPSSPRSCRSFPVLRPPGAIAEDEFLAGCTRCDACIRACPTSSIVHAPARFRGAAGTPMIDPARQPCWMCPDTPCISACEPGVLRADLPPRMGVARIDVTACLASAGKGSGGCSVCVEQCPVPEAIMVGAMVEGGRPRIVEEACTGCGVCQHICPAPGNAILLMPAAQRPPRPQPSEHQEQADA